MTAVLLYTAGYVISICALIPVKKLDVYDFLAMTYWPFCWTIALITVGIRRIMRKRSH